MFCFFMEHLAECRFTDPFRFGKLRMASLTETKTEPCDLYFGIYEDTPDFFLTVYI